MEALNQELRRKREALAQDTGGKRFFKRSEIEQKQIQKLRDQERQELEAKALRHSSSNPLSSSTTQPPSASSSSTAPSSTVPPSSIPQNPNSKSLTEERDIDNLVLGRQEVIRRLRLLKQPITLFGEDDEARLDRFKFVLKAGLFEVDSDMTQGQTNDFLRDIVELKKRQKTGLVSGKRKEREENDANDGDHADGEGELSGDGSNGVDADNDTERMNANFDDLCIEDKILVFFKKLLNEWHQELNEMADSEKRTAKGKSMVATFKQCARYLTPLFKFCRKKVLPHDIRQALLLVVKCCKRRDYLAAMDHYIKLAIGNAPWPIGVTMVGIHERSAREKIYTNSVAHIMNDETTRKYLQSVKRLMTFCQRRYPTMPSKAVEFNSLANGSDLQSLLSEDMSASSHGNTLRLMPRVDDK